MTGEVKNITLKLLVDKEMKKVVFAEADKDFVDVLFSFLTLPLGTIIRLLGDQTRLGSINNIYESIRSLDPKHLQTRACKTMLLCPQSAAALCCEHLKLIVDDTKPREVFCCSKPDCCAKPICLGSPVANARCPHCQQVMDSYMHWPKRDEDFVHSADGDGVFVKGEGTFMISDDLHVNPASLAHSLSLLQKLGIEDGATLEEICMNLSTNEVLKLLKACLISKTPLTAICFSKMEVVDNATHIDIIKPIQMKPLQMKDEEKISTIEINIEIKVKLFVANNKVLCAEAGEQFLDVLLSFLTFPLGSVIKLLDSSFSMGCVSNLYHSVEGLSLDYIKSNECRNMLLSPKLAPFFGCDNQLLKMNEETPRKSPEIGRCMTCYWNLGKDSKCKHGVNKANFIQLNPKSPAGKTEVGGGYAKGPGRFVVAGDLHFYPLTLISMTKCISTQGLPFSKVEEKEVKIEPIDVLNLLRATLMSQTPLNNVFLPHQKRKNRMYSLG